MGTRSLTVHLGEDVAETATDLQSFLEQTSELLAKVRASRAETMSYRVVTPSYQFLSKIHSSGLVNFSKTLDDFAKQHDYDYIATHLGSFSSWVNRIDEVASALGETSRMFFSAVVSEDWLSQEVAEAVAKLFEKTYQAGGWWGCTRLAISYGGVYQTPYFPATTSKETGVSISLLYTKELEKSVDDLEAAVKAVCEKAAEAGEKLALTAQTRFLGIDASLSPWGEDSVAKIVAAMGSRCGSPGSLHAIARINKAIGEAVADFPSTGYNEVMVSLAEDEGLKQDVRDELVDCRWLLSAVPVCVVGFDMVPLSADEEGVACLFKDFLAVSLNKRRVTAFRVIPTELKPGDELDMGMLGKTPVLAV